MMCAWTGKFPATYFTFQNYTSMNITMVEVPSTYCRESTLTCTHFTLKPIPQLPPAYTMLIYIKCWFLSRNTRCRDNWRL